MLCFPCQKQQNNMLSRWMSICWVSWRRLWIRQELFRLKTWILLYFANKYNFCLLGKGLRVIWQISKWKFLHKMCFFTKSIWIKPKHCSCVLWEHFTLICFADWYYFCLPWKGFWEIWQISKCKFCPNTFFFNFKNLVSASNLKCFFLNIFE